MALNNKQQRFVEEYLVDLNATQAAIRAGYSKATASQGAAQLLSNIKVQSAVAEAQKERSKRTQVTSDMVVRELARIGFSDLRNVFGDSGSLLNPDEWDDGTAAAISSIEVVTNTGDRSKSEEGRKMVEHIHKIKVWDKNSALEKLGKHLGMYVDRVETKHDATDSFAALVLKAVDGRTRTK